MSKTVSKFALAAGFSACLGILLGCASAPPPRELAVEKGTFADSRDGKTYKTVKIDEKTWFAENLNYEAEGSKCYDNKPENCAKYGRLYDWNSAMQSCPDGWLVPRKEEWQTLMILAGSGEVAAKRLKATEGWDGTDNYAFSALPGGMGKSNGVFSVIGTISGWWSANVSEFKMFDAKGNIDMVKTAELRDKAYSYFILGSQFGHNSPVPKSELLSTRCVQDKRALETDSRDGKTYKTVKIGGQTWMAENLNYQAEGSKCFGEGGQIAIYELDERGDLQTRVEPKMITLQDSEAQANCAKYGRLYNWETAKAACPSGWHLPTKEEWEVLANSVGGQEAAGGKLKALSGWNLNGNGTDDYYFSALPGGISDTTGNMGGIGYAGSWWSSSEGNKGGAYFQSMAYNHERVIEVNKANLSYLRCLKD